MTIAFHQRCCALLRGTMTAVFAAVDLNGRVVDTDGDWGLCGFDGVVPGRSIDEVVPALVGVLPPPGQELVLLPSIESPGDRYVDLLISAAAEDVVVAAIDVTARGLPLQDLQQSRNDMAISNKALLRTLDDLTRSEAISRRFYAVFGHEVRSSIQNIAAALELMAARLSGAQDSEYLKCAMASTSALIAFVGAAIELERPADESRLTSFVPATLIADIVDEHRAFALRKGVELTLEAGGALAGTACRCDVSRLRRVLSNLVSNAIKFTDEGDVRLRANVVVDNGRWVLRVAVADRGPGLAAEALQAMLQPFAAPAPVTRVHGFGLGLYICNKLLDSIGGGLEVRARPGRGSVFEVTVPVTAG